MGQQHIMRNRNILIMMACLVVPVISAQAEIQYGYQVQSDRVEVTGSSLDVPITAVSDLSKAFVLTSPGTGYANSDTNADIVQVRGYLQATNNVRIERAGSANSTWVSYQVIECFDNEFAAYRGSGYLTATETSAAVGRAQAASLGSGPASPS